MFNVQEALSNPIWINHKIGNTYSMDGVSGWKIAYYPIFENGRTGEVYSEPRALIEKPIAGGTDFREVPLRYLTMFNHLHQTIILRKLRGKSLKGFDLSEVCVAIMNYYI